VRQNFPRIPVTLRIRSRRIRSCREDVMAPESLSGWCPIVLVRCLGWRQCRHFAGTPSRLLVCGRDGPKPVQHRLDKILGQFDSAAVLVT
jgi:hypothetical protein